MLNEALRMIRVFHGLPQTDLAEKLGITQPYLSEIENGKKSPSLELLENYGREFRMPLSSIMFFSENMDGSKADRIRLNVSSKVLALLKFIAARSEKETA